MISKMKKLFKTIENSDGALHFLITYFIASSIALLGYAYAGLITAAVIAMLKEVWDEKYGNGWSWKDITCDAAALLFVWIIIKYR